MSEPLQQFGGSWTSQKLERLREYLIAYHNALKNQPFTLEYYDAFAGTGYNTPKAAPDEQSPLFNDLASPETRQFLDGSARIALQIPGPFNRYVFVERHPERFAELSKLKTDFPLLESRIHLVNDEANQYLTGVCQCADWIKSKRRAVVFLDPFGMQVTWTTIQSIAATRAIDLWLLFPLGIGVMRMLPNHGQIPLAWRKRLDAMFGELIQLPALSPLLCCRQPKGRPDSQADRRTHLETMNSFVDNNAVLGVVSPRRRQPVVRPDNRVGMWSSPALIAPNNFVYKSLSNWAFNVAVGCSHACRFCYVPSAATIKQGPKLAEYGVKDPDAEWGDYVLLRPWDESKFLASLRAAQATPRNLLKPDGNRAVMYCSTTDPYQVIHHADPERQRALTKHARNLVRHSLELIRDRSDLNVRILTRSPLAKADFDLFRSFGRRLLFGMSLPTLRNDLAKVYEPKAPAPSQRLAALEAAREAGIHIYVAVAPTYPECDEKDLRATLQAIAELNPITVFHEPINIRAENVERIRAHAESAGVALNTEVFETREAWQDYAVGALRTVEGLAAELGITNRLHLWPDKSLGSASVANGMPKPAEYLEWLRKSWTRISEWP